MQEYHKELHEKCYYCSGKRQKKCGVCNVGQLHLGLFIIFDVHREEDTIQTTIIQVHAVLAREVVNWTAAIAVELD
jgi:hypothetical protein